ncbi:hypothetical protein CICLE_v10024668mg [Citrus x clementina]|uniref:Uncharacterized protein n=1 Tax=Citrus clementina TaxID=85681 RepID=V4TUK6_CITCL|nr:hypothetical protein CICLE_v10024668mg [Citrus x clementina]
MGRSLTLLLTVISKKVLITYGHNEGFELHLIAATLVQVEHRCCSVLAKRDSGLLCVIMQQMLMISLRSP